MSPALPPAQTFPGVGRKRGRNPPGEGSAAQPRGWKGGGCLPGGVPQPTKAQSFGPFNPGGRSRAPSPRGRGRGERGRRVSPRTLGLEDLPAQSARVLDELFQAALAELPVARELLQHLLQLPLHRHALVHSGRHRAALLLLQLLCRRHRAPLSARAPLSDHSTLAALRQHRPAGAARPGPERRWISTSPSPQAAALVRRQRRGQAGTSAALRHRQCRGHLGRGPRRSPPRGGAAIITQAARRTALGTRPGVL